MPTLMDVGTLAVFFDPAATGCCAELLARLALLPWPLLLLGETGTGKTMLAEYLHRLSGRPGAFQYCSLAGLSDDLATAALCGQVKGAFTGAVCDRLGPFEVAHRGTVCLDELGDCPPRGQGVLLQALDRGLVQRLGETRWRRVDVRVIGCTNADLPALVREQRFREDLVARFGTFVVRLRPLRERRDVILPLVEQFLAQAAAEIGREPPALSARLREALHQAPWPANLRQLLSACRHLAGLAGDVADLRDLPKDMEATASAPGPESQEDRARRVVGECRGNRSKAARVMGISRTQLYRLLEA